MIIITLLSFLGVSLLNLLFYRVMGFEVTVVYVLTQIYMAIIYYGSKRN